jgi:molybdopterin-guanine dinucleotide biosynthesis protein A
MIKNNDLKMQGLLSRLTTRFVEFNEIADLEGSANFFLNLNSPKDYATAVTIEAG